MDATQTNRRLATGVGAANREGDDAAPRDPRSRVTQATWAPLPGPLADTVLLLGPPRVGTTQPAVGLARSGELLGDPVLATGIPWSCVGSVDT